MHVLEKFRPVQAGSLCPNLLLLAPDFPLIRVISEPCYLVAYAQCYMITRTSIRTGGPEPWSPPPPKVRIFWRVPGIFEWPGWPGAPSVLILARMGCL